MRRLLALLVTLAVLIGARPAEAAPLRVVATVPDLAAIVREVGGDRVTVASLSLPSQDPHFVDARPNLALELARADLLVVVGLDLEVGWLPTLVTGSRNPAVQPGAKGWFDASQVIRKLQVPTGAIDRSMGDVHPGGNPHYLLDPRNAIAVASALAQRLSELDPAHADAYASDASAFEVRLGQALTRWQRQTAWLRDLPTIEFHRSMAYLQDWLGFRIVADIEPKPGIPPTPAHVAEVIGAARAAGVKLVLIESYYPSATAELIAEKSGARVAVIPGGTDVAAGQGYIAHVDAVLTSLAASACAAGVRVAEGS